VTRAAGLCAPVVCRAVDGARDERNARNTRTHTPPLHAMRHHPTSHYCVLAYWEVATVRVHETHSRLDTPHTRGAGKGERRRRSRDCVKSGERGDGTYVRFGRVGRGRRTRPRSSTTGPRTRARATRIVDRNGRKHTQTHHKPDGQSVTGSKSGVAQQTSKCRAGKPKATLLALFFFRYYVL
jgi:hypothetical protein